MTIMARGIELRIINGAFYHEVEAPDGSTYLERYIGEDVDVEEVEEVR